MTVRAKLVATCLEGSNPFWDLRRYMKNLENGFQIAFFSFLNGRKPAHIRVADAYDNKGWGVSCVQATDGSCSPVEEGTKWPWAETDELDAFYLTSEAAVARDDELNAIITPEPVLNYHGVSLADVEEFTAVTLQGVTQSRDTEVSSKREGKRVPSNKKKRAHRGENGSRRKKREPIENESEAVRRNRKKRKRSKGGERKLNLDETDDGRTVGKDAAVGDDKKKRTSEGKRRKQRRIQQ